MSSQFTFYDQKGRVVPGNPFPYYRDFQGKLTRVPSMFGPKDQIMKYIQVCMTSGLNLPLSEESMNDETIIAYLEEIWQQGEIDTKKILEMLDRRAKELKEQGLIRHLIYKATYEKLSKLTVPLFNRQQAANIPNLGITQEEIYDMLPN